jgi:arginyl-tRNA--protein-N-Asp/Glu arginylyltransferase
MFLKSLKEILLEAGKTEENIPEEDTEDVSTPKDNKEEVDDTDNVQEDPSNNNDNVNNEEVSSEEIPEETPLTPVDSKEILGLFDSYIDLLDKVKNITSNNQQLFNNITDDSIRKLILLNYSNLEKTKEQIKAIIKKDFTTENLENFKTIYDQIENKISLLISEIGKIANMIK